MNNRKLIYNFNEHGLYYENKGTLNAEAEKVISLTISRIELEFDYLTGNLLTVTGFQPLIEETLGCLETPYYKDGDFSISMDEINYQRGVAYDYFDFFPASREYFMIDEYNPKLIYDENDKRILIGSADINDEYIKVNKNIICGLDRKGNLKSILVLVDVIIKEN